MHFRPKTGFQLVRLHHFIENHAQMFQTVYELILELDAKLSNFGRLVWLASNLTPFLLKPIQQNKQL